MVPIKRLCSRRRIRMWNSKVKIFRVNKIAIDSVDHTSNFIDRCGLILIFTLKLVKEHYSIARTQTTKHQNHNGFTPIVANVLH
ncbi:Hypothetical predicted protein [Octopus vulgaris]|uniref:Uncharacterized protein n=1 Tax=Octopus vulgaris TaxID=6645 RepID=A0AA36FC52_OCTVU|nr:Hypothetical predicted protein [Octopus vulgaris]